MLFEAVAQGAVGGGGSFAFRHHDNVDGRNFIAMTAKGLSCLALDTIAANGAGRNLAGNSQAQTRFFQSVGGGEQREKGIAGTETLAKHASERFRCQQSKLAGKPEASFGVTRFAYGQSRARPFARRAFSTFRPPLVAMRARKPWVRARRTLLG